MNLTILKGNITRDVEVTFTPKGTAVCEIGLAVNEVWFNDAGEKQEEVTFIDCRAWGRQAETIGKNFHKGKPILIEGKLKQERWVDKATEKPRSKTLVIVQHWEFAGDVRPRSGNDQTRMTNDEGRKTEPPQAGTTEREPERPIQDGMEEDDIPF